MPLAGLMTQECHPEGLGAVPFQRNHGGCRVAGAQSPGGRVAGECPLASEGGPVAEGKAQMQDDASALSPISPLKSSARFLVAHLST